MIFHRKQQNGYIQRAKPFYNTGGTQNNSEINRMIDKRGIIGRELHQQQTPHCTSCLIPHPIVSHYQYILQCNKPILHAVDIQITPLLSTIGIVTSHIKSPHCFPSRDRHLNLDPPCRRRDRHLRTG
jgi:hypothetical protein